MGWTRDSLAQLHRSDSRKARVGSWRRRAARRGAGAPILTVEDNYVGGIGSEIAEAAAASGDGPRVRMLAVRNIPKSGRTADDVLAYVHLSVAEIVQAAKTLTRQRAPARS